MSKVAAIYTGQALVSPVSAYFKRKYPDHQLINILDDGLIASVMASGKMTSAVLRQIYAYCREAREAGADIILQTCSSVGQSVDKIQPFFDIPILRIDTPMTEMAVGKYERIAVLATLPTTLEPSMDLVQETAKKQGKNLKVVNGLASGAFEALSAGDAETHDARILETAEKLKNDCDAFLLAQGSMARMKDKLEKLAGKPVVTSPESGVDALAAYLGGGE